VHHPHGNSPISQPENLNNRGCVGVDKAGYVLALEGRLPVSKDMATLWTAIRFASAIVFSLQLSVVVTSTSIPQLLNLGSLRVYSLILSSDKRIHSTHVTE